MRLLQVRVSNFGSYEELEFDFESQGLALIHGATGSGKSTIQDAVPWVLFGQTAKDGNSDDIRAWDSQSTIGILNIQLNTSELEIVRIRGKSNDLYWNEAGNTYRGKDITETQKLLNERLGLDPYIYTIGGYYNEFSPTGSFFLAKASDRRQLFENLANMELPIKLMERITDERKKTKKIITATTQDHFKVTGQLEGARGFEETTKRNVETWEKTKKETIKNLKSKSEKWEEDQIVKLKSLELQLEIVPPAKSCSNCGHSSEEHKTQRSEQIQFLSSQIELHKNRKNPFIEILQDEDAKINPFFSQKHTINCDIDKLEEHKNLLQSLLDTLNHKYGSLDQLSSLCDELRRELLRNTVSTIEDSTNNYLESYFDSEIRVGFELEGSDKLKIIVHKSGHECSYKQLSKGQRSLLKLCFSVSCMKAASNKAGIHFNTLFFDESLDGLDSALKVKAFNLFCELEKYHETVLVIDHNDELKSMFYKKFKVQLDNDHSTISEE